MREWESSMLTATERLLPERVHMFPAMETVEGRPFSQFRHGHEFKTFRLGDRYRWHGFNRPGVNVWDNTIGQAVSL
jgi:hypothetical protein